MSRLPKYNIENQVHFVTTTVHKNTWLFQEEKFCNIIIDNLNFYRKKFLFNLIGYVIMPWHLHLLLQLSTRYNNISQIMQSIKSHSAKEIVYYLQTGRRKPSLSSYSQAASEGLPLPQDYQWVNEGRIHTPAKNKIWQKDFYDFNIYTEKKLREKLNYIHNNPVKHGLVKNPEDWKYSSFQNYYLNNDSIIKIDKIGL